MSGANSSDAWPPRNHSLEGFGAGRRVLVIIGMCVVSNLNTENSFLINDYNQFIT